MAFVGGTTETLPTLFDISDHARVFLHLTTQAPKNDDNPFSTKVC